MVTQRQNPSLVSFARILATTSANAGSEHMKLNLQHCYRTLQEPTANPVELKLWTAGANPRDPNVNNSQCAV
jgi:hypothetical protein